MKFHDQPAGWRARLAPFARELLATVRTQHGAWRGRGRQWRPTRRGVVFGSMLVVPFLLIGWERCGVRGCPAVDVLASYQPGGAPVLLDRDGETLAELAPFDRAIVSLESLPDHVPEAFIAVEDQRFHEHGGLDYRRVAGAVLADLKAGGFVQGSSTITMQVARNVFPDRLPGAQKTMRRKLLEVRVAREIEDRFSKEEILELYLNHIYFGGSAYGIEAASRYYFGRPAAELTLSQAAMLAALPRSPTYYNPRRNAQAARTRRDLVLTLMEEQGRISADQASAARNAGLRLAAEPRSRRGEAQPAPFFVEAVRRDLEDRFGDALYSSALRIHTTLDRRVQRAAEEELERKLRELERGAHGRFAGTRYSAAARPDTSGTRYLQGAVVVLDAHDGDVLALVGGRDFAHSRYDRALRARRQVGSAFKPFVFAAALERGYAPSQHVADEPLRMELAGGEVWEPRNFTGRFQGDMTLRDALVRSQNVPAVRLASSVGLRRVANTARAAGVNSEIPQLPSMALGTAALSPLELTTAYTAFANGGERVLPRWVTRIEDAAGEVIWQPKPQRRRVLKPAVAFLVTDMLADAVERGTATAVRSAGYRGPAAGKTGTTDSGTDTWFVGYTPDLVAGVWIGFDSPQPIAGDASGGEVAAPLWGRLMRRVYADRPQPSPWEPPSRVVQREIDPVSGLVLAEGCRPARGQPKQEYFARGDVPAKICPVGEERDRGPGLLAMAGSLLRNVWYRSEQWVLGRLGRGDDDEPVLADQERYLGAARLPRAAEVRRPEVDTSAYPRLLGVPWVPDTIEPAEPVVIDTIARPTVTDTIVIRPDTLPRRDTLPRLPRDTLRPPPDTVPPVRRDTIPAAR